MEMIMELVGVGLIVSSCLAIYLDEAVYSVSSLACTFIFMATLYALNDAVFVAIFHLAVGAGILAVLFLSSEMLSEKSDKKKTSRNFLLVLVAASLLSLPVIFFSTVIAPANVSSDISFAEAFWNLRAIDVVLQGLTVVIVSLGVLIILYERREGES